MGAWVRGASAVWPIIALLGCEAFDAELLERTESGANAVQGRDAGHVVARDAGRDVVEPCAARAERCNGQDDDCDGSIDEGAEADCSFEHGAGACVPGGTCVLALCEPGYANCNRELEDGCEQRVSTIECDECGRVCTPDTGGGRPSRFDAGVADEDGGVVACIPSEEQCNDLDDDCDDRADEGDVCATSACKATTPSYRSPSCDACTCSTCASLVAQCQNHPDPDWAQKCRALVECYVVRDAAGECGANADCYMSGSGPCAAEVNLASGGADAMDTTQLGAGCAAGVPPAAPCAAAVNYRDQCTLTACADQCGG